MKKNLIKTLLIAYVFLVGCGFKAINQSEMISFDIAEIETLGNKIINFKLKNKLQVRSKESDKQLIKISLNTSKLKKIKEKNIQNQITKYDINIAVTVGARLINERDEIKFSVSEFGSYNVNNQHSLTLRNEKKLVDLLVDSLAKKILYQLRISLDDL
tara:strand:+ start:1101 stop:1574 length:474 start_codon:yes stop_codon:yes gene_type:complete